MVESRVASEVRAFQNVYIQESGVTPYQKPQKSGEIEAGETLLNDTLNLARTVLGDDPTVEHCVVTTQTGIGYYPDLLERMVAGLKARGVRLLGEPVIRRSFSNSQPILSDAAVHAENGQRTLLLALEPLESLPKEDRNRRIGEDILNGACESDHRQFSSMVAGLDALIERYLTDRFRVDAVRRATHQRILATEFHAARQQNPWAQNRKPLDYSDIENDNPLIEGTGFHRLDCCPITNRGAALLLVPQDRVNTPERAVRLDVVGTEVDGRPLEQRFLFNDYPKNEALYRLMQKILTEPTLIQRGITRELIREGIRELHNAVQPLVLMALEEMGYELHDLFQVNPSGGLLSGHPLAATYPMLMHWSRLQLLGEAETMQVKPPVKQALIQSIGGLRTWMSVTILSRS